MRISRAEITRAVTEAKRHLGQAQRPRTVVSRLAADRVLEKATNHWLRSTGVDVKAMRAAEAQRGREWDRSVSGQADVASKRWAARIKRTRADVTGFAQSTQPAAADFLPPDSITLDSPVSIVASDPRTLKSSEIVPFGSSAKVVVDREAGSVDKVSFVYVFRSTQSNAFFYDFHASLGASGHLALRQKGHLTGGFGSVEVKAEIEVLPSATSVAPQRLAALGTAAGGPPFWWVDATNKTAFSDGTLLTASAVVEARGSTVILVSVAVDSDFDGHLIADMNTGQFGILCPVVLAVRKARLS